MNKRTVKDFRNYNFDNTDVDEKYWGDYTALNYCRGEFKPLVRKEMKALAKRIGATVADFSSCNGFDFVTVLQQGTKFIYVSIDDVRDCGMGRWYDRVLYRTMKHAKDWSGGGNNYCSYEELEEHLTRLFERMQEWD